MSGTGSETRALNISDTLSDETVWLVFKAWGLFKSETKQNRQSWLALLAGNEGHGG